MVAIAVLRSPKPKSARCIDVIRGRQNTVPQLG
jgi:hypothetical protein